MEYHKEAVEQLAGNSCFFLRPQDGSFRLHAHGLPRIDQLIARGNDIKDYVLSQAQAGTHYEGIGSTKKWEHLESYGPKFVENVVQAVSIALLMNAMKNLPVFYICGHVHDELIIESRDDVSLDEVCKAMAHNSSWMLDILLRADGYTTEFYMRD